MKRRVTGVSVKSRALSVNTHLIPSVSERNSGSEREATQEML